MASVSQKGRRQRRPWTPKDQIIAEVAAACGVSCLKIGQTLGWSDTAVKRHLSPAVAKIQRERARLRYESNPERARENTRRWREANIELARERARYYRQRNPEKDRERRRRWRQANPEKTQELCRRWREANTEKVREYARNYREANPDKVSERRRLYYQANSDKERKSHRRWSESNRDKLSDRSRRRYAWKRAARQRALVPVTPDQIEARFALWHYRCAFCGVDANHPRNHGRKRLTEEHVLALKNEGLDEASNIIPSCSTCNSSKHIAPVEAWYRRQPFFTEPRWRKIQRHCPAAVVGQLPLALL